MTTHKLEISVRYKGQTSYTAFGEVNGLEFHCNKAGFINAVSFHLAGKYKRINTKEVSRIRIH